MIFKTIKEFIKKIPFFYQLYLDIYKYYFIRKEGESLCENLAATTSLDTKVEVLLNNKYFHSSQKKNEILRFLSLASNLNPRIICEIGTRKGGTLILLSRVAASDATLISIDLKYPYVRFPDILKRMILPNQKLICIEKSSTDPKTEKFVGKLLGDKKIDLLFIDGDHSYNGVSNDYKRFKKYVNPEGVIAFHDIHPDSFSLFGLKTETYVGDVPRFWNEIINVEKMEFIEDKKQDGCGIGVLTLSKDIKW